MRFVCSTLGSSGDVFPMLGLAIELGNRGHDVVLATNGHFAAAATRHGLSFETLGNEEDYVACIKNPDLWHPRRSFRYLFQTLQPTLRRQYEILEEQSRLGKVISITSCFGFGALLAQDKLKIPTITMHLQPAVIWSDCEPPALAGVNGPRWWRRFSFRIGERFFIDPVVCPFINPWRRELGLPPMLQTVRWWNSPYAVLCAFPNWFAKPQPDWPKNLIQTDFPLWNDRSSEALSSNVETFLNQGEAPVVFTPGSANVHGRAFFDAAVQACQSLKRRAILLTEFCEQVPTNLPSTMIHFSYVPLDRLLPRASAFVHHGGIGSMSQSMLAGIPQVMMPLAHDQFDNAERIRKLGIGDSIPAHRFTASRLREVLQRLWNSPTVASDCQAISRRLAPRDGLQRAAIAIEERMMRLL